MNRREQLIIVGVVMAALAVGFYLKLVSPKVSKAKELQTQLTAAQNTRDTAVGQASTAQAAAASYSSNIGTIKSLRVALPESDALPTLLRELQRTADAAHVKFTSLTTTSSGGTSAAAAGGAAAGGRVSRYSGAPGVPVVPPGYAGGTAPTVSYTLQFSGGYMKLQKFLADIYDLVSLRNGQADPHGRLINVRSVGIGGTAGKEKVTISAEAYLMPPALQTPIPTPGRAAEAASKAVPASGSSHGTRHVVSATPAR